jgi:profilin
VGTGKVVKAAILGLGGGVWAASQGYSVRAIYISYCPSYPSIPLSQLSLDEQKAILTAYAEREETQKNGIRLSGHKFFALRVDDRSIYLKKGVWLKLI